MWQVVIQVLLGATQTNLLIRHQEAVAPGGPVPCLEGVGMWLMLYYVKPYSKQIHGNTAGVPLCPTSAKGQDSPSPHILNYGLATCPWMCLLAQ